MATRFSMQRRLRMNRPTLRLRSKPPKLRTPRGEDFTAANLGVALSMQVCTDCGSINYPPRELCGQCLADALLWKPVDDSGTLLQAVELHHSLWEFFKRRLKNSSWPIATVKMHSGPVVFAHLAAHLFDLGGSASALSSGSELKVFSFTDSGRQAVLIAVPATVDVACGKQRAKIANEMGLATVAERQSAETS